MVRPARHLQQVGTAPRSQRTAIGDPRSRVPAAHDAARRFAWPRSVRVAAARSTSPPARQPCAPASVLPAAAEPPLARAIAPRPCVLLLDEPLTALDARLREDLRVEIDTLLRSLQITTVYVTHDQAEAMALGDRIAVMDHGQIAQIGSPHEIYFSPANTFVADFIGTINRIAGEPAAGRLQFAGGHVPLANGTLVREVMFRPEDLQLVAPERAHFSGTVLSSFFLGDHTRVVIDAGAGAPLVARVQQRIGVRKGDAVHCMVDAAALLNLGH